MLFRYRRMRERAAWRALLVTPRQVIFSLWRAVLVTPRWSVKTFVPIRVSECTYCISLRDVTVACEANRGGQRRGITIWLWTFGGGTRRCNTTESLPPLYLMSFPLRPRSFQNTHTNTRLMATLLRVTLQNYSHPLPPFLHPQAKNLSTRLSAMNSPEATDLLPSPCSLC